MRNLRVFVLALLAAVVVAAGLVGFAVAKRTFALPASLTASAAPGLILEADRATVPANGTATFMVVIRPSDSRRLNPREVSLTVREGERRIQIVSMSSDNLGGTKAVLRAGIMPGPVVLEARTKNTAPVQTRLMTVLDPSDQAGDGMPDFLRLDDPGDQEAFRRWFAFLAETQAFRLPGDALREINDCAALLRFSYREALREHDGPWARALALPHLPAAGSIRKYRYPYTPLGAALFRVGPGAFRSEDLTRGAFAEFADADTLRRFNTHLVTRDIARAQPGDLLFFRQLEQNLPFHVMVFVGPSQLAPSASKGMESDVRRVPQRQPGSWIVYHTGPLGKSRGEVRRVTVGALLEHPSPRWRPVPGNPNFLGVYRWNILRQAN